jgi:hypothetical protein
MRASVAVDSPVVKRLHRAVVDVKRDAFVAFDLGEKAYLAWADG